MILASTVAGPALNKQFDRLDGVVLLCGLMIYLALLLRQSRQSGHHHNTHAQPHTPWLHNIALMLLALILLGAAGHLLLGAAVTAATELGLSEWIIGLTIIVPSALHCRNWPRH